MLKRTLGGILNFIGFGALGDTRPEAGKGQRENGPLLYEAKSMRIEALISAADAAGYAMVSEESSDDFGAEEIVSLKSETSLSNALAVWHPVVAAGTKSVGAQFANAWSWVAGRFITSAPA